MLQIFINLETIWCYDGFIIENVDLSHIYLAVKTFCVDSQSKTFKLKKMLWLDQKKTTHEGNIKQHPYKSNVLDSSFSDLLLWPSLSFEYYTISVQQKFQIVYIIKQNVIYALNK